MSQWIFTAPKKVLKEEDIQSKSYNHSYIKGKVL